MLTARSNTRPHTHRYLVPYPSSLAVVGGGTVVASGGAGGETGYDPLVRLHRAILEAADPTLHSPHITLGGGVFWPNLASSTLFVRGFYAPLYESVLGGLRRVMNARMLCDKFILMGSPGIGKSSFGLYALFRALREGRTVVYASGPLKATWTLSRSAYACSDILTGWAYPKAIHSADTVLICDSVTPPVCEAFTLLVTSPKKTVWGEFAKSPGCRRLFFPVLAADEIEAMRAACFPTVDVGGVVERYERWGGVPRYVLGMLDDESQGMLETAIGGATLDMLQAAMATESVEADVPHRLLHFKVRGELDEFDVVDPRDPAFFKLARAELASAYVVRRVHEQALAMDAVRLAYLLTNSTSHPSAAVLRGNLFEAHALQLLSLGGPFEVRYLSGPRVPGGVTTELSLPPAAERWFGDVGEVGGLPRTQRDALLLRPKSKGFVAIDAVLQGCVFVNTTTNVEHTIALIGKSRRGLTATLGAFGLGTEGVITFCWVVPHDVFPRFLVPAPFTEAGKRLASAEVVGHAVAARISQYVLRMPPFVDEAGNLRKRSRE